MDSVKNPEGDVYDIRLKGSKKILIPFGAEGFSVKVGVVNSSKSTWDTSDNLRLAARLINPAEKDWPHPFCFVDKRLSFRDRYVPPETEIVFEVDMLLNLIPQGSYLLIFDLVVEQKYFLSFTGAKRPSFEFDIVDVGLEGARFHPGIRLPPMAPRRTGLADIRSTSPDSAFQLLSATGEAEPVGTGNVVGSQVSRLKDYLAPKRIAVIYKWDIHFFRHYAHFLEFIICLYAICREYIGEVEDITIIAPDQEFSSGSNPDVQRFMLGSLFNKWTVLTHIDNNIDGFTHVINFDGNRQKTLMNRIIVDYVDVVVPWMASFKNRCLRETASISGRSNRKVAIYAKRSGSRSIAKALEREFISVFSDSGYEVVEIDFGALTIQQQIVVTNGASIMFGAHGNNLTNCVWLPRGAALVEVFPPGFHSFDFQILCEASGSRYLGIEGKRNGFVLRETARLPDWTLLGPPYSTHEHHQDDIDFIQINVLRAFLRDYV